MKKIRKSSKKKSKKNEKIDEKSRRFSDTAFSGIKDSVSRRQASFWNILNNFRLNFNPRTSYVYKIWRQSLLCRSKHISLITFVRATGTGG